MLLFLLTALTELEELTIDRTVITDEGCTVLSSKPFYHYYENIDILGGINPFVLPELNLESINVVVPFESVVETLVCDHSNESY